MNQGNPSGLPDYKKPPVIEVVCGIAFEPIEKFRGHHIGLFWQKIRDEFPVCEHALKLGLKPEPLDLRSYLPRMWFINKDNNKLIQLENERFFYNWRKEQADEEYPHYTKIIEPFKANLKIYQEFIEKENLGSVNPLECELTYTNNIPKGEGWETTSDASKVFRDFTWNTNKRFLPDPISFGGHTIFSLPEGKGRLEVTIQQAKRKIDGHPLLILQLTAKGLGPDKSMDVVWEWFDVAHEWIVCGFTDLTAPQIQTDIWQRTL